MNRKSLRLIPLIVILAITVSEMATDIFVPSLPNLTRYFASSEEVVSLTLSFYMLGFSLSGPIYGPLSDAYGRRPVFLTGIMIFVLMSLLCVLAEGIESLIILRTLQGVGAGAAVVVGTAVIKDLFDAEECAKMMTLMGIVMSASPGIAPLLGGYIAQAFGWQAVFLVVFIVSGLIGFLCVVALKETRPKSLRETLSIGRSLGDYAELFCSLPFMMYALTCSLTFGAIWAYISATTFFFIDELGFSMEAYGYFQAFLVGGYILASFVNKYLLGRLKVEQVLSLGLVCFVISGLLLVLGTWMYPVDAYMITLSMLPLSMSASLVFPNAATLSLEVFPEKSGVASALLSFLEMAGGALMVFVTQLVYQGSFVPVAFSMFVLTLFVGGVALLPARFMQKNPSE